MQLGRTVSLRVAFSVLLLGGCASHAATTDQSNINGYGKTTWGMTPDQVLNAEAPEAKRVENPEPLGDLTSAVVIGEIQLGTDKFSAQFYFDSDRRLQTVVVTCLEKKNLQANALTFSFLEKLFTSKYGFPTYREGGTRPRVFWELPQTTVRLVHFTAFGGNISRVNFSYMPSGLSSR